MKCQEREGPGANVRRLFEEVEEEERAPGEKPEEGGAILMRFGVSCVNDVF